MNDNIEQVFEVLYQHLLDKIFYLAKVHTEIQAISEIHCPFDRGHFIERFLWASNILTILENQRLSELNLQPYITVQGSYLGLGEYKVAITSHVRLPSVPVPFDNLISHNIGRVVNIKKSDFLSVAGAGAA